jgi:hypothetical protein
LFPNTLIAQVLFTGTAKDVNEKTEQKTVYSMRAERNLTQYPRISQ